MSQNETEVAKRERLRKQLDDTHTWPCEFTFKFIVASDEEGEAAAPPAAAQPRHRQVPDSPQRTRRRAS